eukprot:m.31429 g.31429  ORF g.31429 m.31429 type:complete len:60 (+) comp13974_c0_seq2:115-294(+)
MCNSMVVVCSVCEDNVRACPAAGACSGCHIARHMPPVQLCWDRIPLSVGKGYRVPTIDL